MKPDRNIGKKITRKQALKIVERIGRRANKPDRKKEVWKIKPYDPLKNMTGETGVIMPCKHGVTPPEYCDICAVPFERPKKCYAPATCYCPKCYAKRPPTPKPSIDPKAFEKMCNRLFNKLQWIIFKKKGYGYEQQGTDTSRKELKSALKVYLKERGGK